jgi:predicted acyltransferase
VGSHHALFLFLVGTSMPLSLSKRLSKGVPRGSIYLQTLRRVCVLWILGMAAQGNLLSFDPTSFHYNSTLSRRSQPGTWCR